VIAMQTHEEAVREGRLSQAPPGVPSRLEEQHHTRSDMGQPGHS